LKDYLDWGPGPIWRRGRQMDHDVERKEKKISKIWKI